MAVRSLIAADTDPTPRAAAATSKDNSTHSPFTVARLPPRRANVTIAQAKGSSRLPPSRVSVWPAPQNRARPTCRAARASPKPKGSSRLPPSRVSVHFAQAKTARDPPAEPRERRPSQREFEAPAEPRERPLRPSQNRAQPTCRAARASPKPKGSSRLPPSRASVHFAQAKTAPDPPAEPRERRPSQKGVRGSRRAARASTSPKPKPRTTHLPSRASVAQAKREFEAPAEPR